jgi:hypothetical protein
LEGRGEGQFRQAGNNKANRALFPDLRDLQPDRAVIPGARKPSSSQS